MIDTRKAEIYRKHQGDYDSFLRSAAPWEVSELEEGDWATMESIVFDLKTQRLVQRDSEPPKGRKGTHKVGRRTFTPMTNKEAEEANAHAERFNGVVKDSEYELVLSILGELA